MRKSQQTRIRLLLANIQSVLTYSVLTSHTQRTNILRSTCSTAGEMLEPAGRMTENETWLSENNGATGGGGGGGGAWD